MGDIKKDCKCVMKTFFNFKKNYLGIFLLVYIILMQTNINPKKSPQTYTCIKCEYNTSNIKDYNKHLATAKHQRLIITNEYPKKIPNEETHICECGKFYKHMSSLCKHKKNVSLHLNILNTN